MQFIYRIVIILLFTGLICSPLSSASMSPRQAEARQVVVAHVTYAHDPVYVNGKSHPFALTLPRDPHPPIYSGWTVSCRNKGVLEFCFDGGRIVRLTSASKPYHVPYVPQETTAHEAGKVLLIPAGLRQSIAANIFSPPQHDGIVWPDKFAFRWTPTPQKVRLILRLYSKVRDDTPSLWESPEIEANNKEFVFPDAQEALRKLRANQPNAQVELSLVTPDDKSKEIRFRLLSKEEETTLKAELNSLETEKEPQRSIERSYAFMRRHLYTEAADEMEKALAAFPDSVSLRFAVIWAHRRSGNIERAEFHTKLLPPETHIPGD